MLTTTNRLRTIARVTVAALSLIAGLAIATEAQARRAFLDLASDDVVVKTPSDERLGDFMVVAVDVPDGVTRDNLISAILELNLTVDTTVDTVFTEVGDTIVYWNDAPVLEVYALREPIGDAYSEDAIDRRYAFHVPAMIDRNRVVRIDITKAVLFYLANPLLNKGLVIGSLSDDREGLFTLNRNGFGSGVPARMRVNYHQAPKQSRVLR